MITIERTHSICAGHRVYKQGGKCEHLHGHQYIITFVIGANKLNKVGMIIDFGELKSLLCEWLELHWDHRLLIWEEDPWAEQLRAIDETVVLVPFNPTAENMSKYLIEKIGPIQLYNYGCKLIKCIVKETDKCSATCTLEEEKRLEATATSK